MDEICRPDDQRGRLRLRRAALLRRGDAARIVRPAVRVRRTACRGGKEPHPQGIGLHRLPRQPDGHLSRLPRQPRRTGQDSQDHRCREKGPRHADHRHQHQGFRIPRKPLRQQHPAGKGPDAGAQGVCAGTLRFPLGDLHHLLRARRLGGAGALRPRIGTRGQGANPRMDRKRDGPRPERGRNQVPLPRILRLPAPGVLPRTAPLRLCGGVCHTLVHRYRRDETHPRNLAGQAEPFGNLPGGIHLRTGKRRIQRVDRDHGAPLPR